MQGRVSNPPFLTYAESTEKNGARASRPQFCLTRRREEEKPPPCPLFKGGVGEADGGLWVPPKAGGCLLKKIYRKERIDHKEKEDYAKAHFKSALTSFTRWTTLLPSRSSLLYR